MHLDTLVTTVSYSVWYVFPWLEKKRERNYTGLQDIFSCAVLSFEYFLIKMNSEMPRFSIYHIPTFLFNERMKIQEYHIEYVSES